MDVVSVFAFTVFAAAWWFRSRTPRDERLVILFFNALMVMAALVGLLGYVNRQLYMS